VDKNSLHEVSSVHRGVQIICGVRSGAQLIAQPHGLELTGPQSLLLVPFDRIFCRNTHVRKPVGITPITAGLLSGGAGVANATAASAPAPSSTTTTLVEDNGTANDQDSDKTGLWGVVASWSARTRRTQAAQRHQRRPLAAGPAAPGNPNTPRR
jgi:hypothetical protein